jgi:ankyrin repeat protein
LTLLLNFGADINGAGASGVTALIAAHTDMECARFLLQRGADPNVRPKSGWTPLHFAIHAASPGMVQLLIEAGADANSRNNDGKSLLAFASKQNDSVIVELLRAAGARWNNSE